MWTNENNFEIIFSEHIDRVLQNSCISYSKYMLSNILTATTLR